MLVSSSWTANLREQVLYPADWRRSPQDAKVEAIPPYKTLNRRTPQVIEGRQTSQVLEQTLYVKNHPIPTIVSILDHLNSSCISKRF